MQVRKQQLELDMEQQTGSKEEKEYVKAVYCYPAYLTYMKSTSCKNARLDEAQAGINIARRNMNVLRYADDITLMAESEEAGLKFNIQKTKIITSHPITSWQIDGETVQTVTDLFSWAPKSLQIVTAAMKLKDASSLKEKL